MLAIQSDYQAISGHFAIFNFKSFPEICQSKLSWLTILYIKKNTQSHSQHSLQIKRSLRKRMLGREHGGMNSC